MPRWDSAAPATRNSRRRAHRSGTGTVHRVAGVVPQQMVGPAARLAERIRVGATKEIRLHVHLQHLEFAGPDALVDPLMTRIEAPRVPAHGDQPAGALRRHHALGTGQRIGDRNLDHDVPAGLEALDGLRRVQLRRRGQQYRRHTWQRQACGQIGADVLNVEFLRHFAGAGSSRPTSDTTSMPSILAMASRCLMPNAPAPARHDFMRCAPSDLVVE